MDVPDMFITTITNDERSIMEDMELPSEMPVSGLCRQVLMVLKEIHEDIFGGWVRCRIEYNNRILEDGDTLLKAGAFDGSLLVVRGE